jgi:adenylate cyclase
MRCPECSFENPEGVRFCGSCGAALATVCPVCGAENPPGFRFCGSCGAALEPGEAVEIPTAVLGERRRVTVLFADLVGFSTLAEHLDPEELRTLMTDTFGELTEEVEKREGFVEKFIGDAVVAVFGAPVTHEDDPARAVEAALAMLDVVRRRSEAAPAPLQLRIGVNSGLVVAGAVGDGTQTGVMGDAVNVAARLQQAAEPGEILLAASTWRRVRDDFDADSIGGLEVKGKAQPVDAYRLAGRAERSRQRAPFVGRREELALLDLLSASARKGNTHVASVIGDPGVGKSRLLSEFRPSAVELDLRVACSGERAFGPFLDLLERILGGAPADTRELETKAAALGVGADDATLIAPFLGLGEAPPVIRMADEQRKRQVFASVWQFLAAVCRDRPTFVAFDDVHWADESSRELLDFLLERLTGVPLMLVLCYRPGFEQVERAELRASHTAIRLESLTPDDSVALARGFLGVADLPADLERLVATRAEGNPFFIEELLQALLELGSLAVVDGRAVLARIELDVPDTVQGTILARVDRLDPQARSVLQHAAVLGRSFSSELLEAVVGEGDLGEPLSALARAQLLMMPRPGECTFKHALIQEVTYDTLLLRRRRELHAKVAEALEASVGDDPALLEVLAEHYAVAEVPEKARRYAVAAGDVARERMGFSEAKRRYETGLRLWGEGDERGRLELLMRFGVAARVSGDQASARTALLEAAEGWRQLGEVRRAGEALAGLGRSYWVAGESERSMEVLERAITMLAEGEPSPELVQAYNWASTGQMLLGRHVEAIELATKGLELADQLGLDDVRSHLLNTLGVSRSSTGDLEGMKLVRESLELALRVGDAEAIGRAYTNYAEMLWDTGSFEEAIALTREGREWDRELGLVQYEVFHAGNEAGMLIDIGRLNEADELTAQVLSEQHPGSSGVSVGNAAIQRLKLLIRLGRYDEARTLLDETGPLVRAMGGPEYQGAAFRLEAELEDARRNVAAARQAARDGRDYFLTAPAQTEWLWFLPLAARLLPRDELAEMLDQLGDVPPIPIFQARLAELEAALDRNPEAARRAADLYREVGMPYEEALCRLDAGELERARELMEAFGFEKGPLGARLAELAQEPRPIHSSPPS